MMSETRQQIRLLWLELPETVKRLNRGAPAFFVKGKNAS
jgi:hypothetical protein